MQELGFEVNLPSFPPAHESRPTQIYHGMVAGKDQRPLLLDSKHTFATALPMTVGPLAKYSSSSTISNGQIWGPRSMLQVNIRDRIITVRLVSNKPVSIGGGFQTSEGN
jgi:hypothetical protein